MPISLLVVPALVAIAGHGAAGHRAVARPAGACTGSPAGSAPRATSNDNRVPAGTRRGDTLVLSLVAARARWYPEAEDGCSLGVLAFAEEGRAPSVPGPLVRVRAGTVMRMCVRNATGRTIWVRGLHDRPAPANTAALEVPADSVREVTFVARTPGTFAYQATTANFVNGGTTVRPLRDDSQLVGAFVVDEPSASRRPNDRILVMTRWAIVDSSGPQNALPYFVTAMNGRSWPWTERLEYAEGDSVHWRVVNGSAANHPMHLHGFYFRVDAKGTTTSDSLLARPRLVVTEVMPVGTTMRMSWRAERAGNWLFHCHLLVHMSTRQHLARLYAGDTLRAAEETRRVSSAMQGHDHATAGMAGLIVGVNVRPARTRTVARRADLPRRTLRLFANVRPGRGDTAAAYGFVLQEGATAPAPDSVRRPGSPIVLRRGEPVQVTVFNRLAVPLSVHWHGMELESYFDGVGGFSGSAMHVAPPIAPGDSFVVRLTPPRAGTFMYHVHGEDGDELAQGLYAPLLVLDDPASRDTTVDHVLLVSDSSPRRVDGALVNGSTAPPLRLVAGRTHRLRVIGITGSVPAELLLLSGADTVRWRLVARDGADVAGEPLTPARTLAGPGVIADYELTPTTAGTLTLQVTSGIPTASRYLRRWSAPIPVVTGPVTIGARQRP
jgi:FtsP/CotA-like multicopper oxidase with cupredoxin domain